MKVKRKMKKRKGARTTRMGMKKRWKMKPVQETELL
jgi:hypothetical protein